jgi:hypothetical protein
MSTACPAARCASSKRACQAVTATTGTAAAAMSSSPAGFLAIIPDKAIAYSA